MIGCDKPYEYCSAPLVDLSNYEFKSLTDKIVKPEESFITSYINKCLKSETTISSMRIMRRILDTKYEKADLKNS